MNEEGNPEISSWVKKTSTVFLNDFLPIQKEGFDEISWFPVLRIQSLFMKLDDSYIDLISQNEAFSDMLLKLFDRTDLTPRIKLLLVSLRLY